jgi:hypothetical protein
VGRIVGVMVGARGVHVQAKTGGLPEGDTRRARAVTGGQPRAATQAPREA